MGLHLNKINKDKKFRFVLLKKEFKLRKIRSLISNFKLNKNIKILLSKRLIYFSKKGIVPLIKNRCFFTSRSRSVYRICKFSRITFKNEISYGNLTGFRKSSW